MKLKRKAKGLTDYKLRMGLIKSKKPRLVVRKSVHQISAQVINYDPNGDRIVITVRTTDLKKHFGWSYSLRNTPSAYLLGLLVASKCVKKNIKELVLDIGLNSKTKGSILFTVLQGAVDGGLNIPHDKSVFASNDRIKGDHIKNDKNKKKYTKSNPENIVQDFEKTKQKLLVEIKQK